MKKLGSFIVFAIIAVAMAISVCSIAKNFAYAATIYEYVEKVLVNGGTLIINGGEFYSISGDGEWNNGPGYKDESGTNIKFVKNIFRTTNNGKFELNGVDISGNENNDSGLIFVEDGTFTMTGGSITNNKIQDAYSGFDDAKSYGNFWNNSLIFVKSSNVNTNIVIDGVNISNNEGGFAGISMFHYIPNIPDPDLQYEVTLKNIVMQENNYSSKYSDGGYDLFLAGGNWDYSNTSDTTLAYYDHILIENCTFDRGIWLEDCAAEININNCNVKRFSCHYNDPLITIEGGNYGSFDSGSAYETLTINGATLENGFQCSYVRQLYMTDVEISGVSGHGLALAITGRDFNSYPDSGINKCRSELTNCKITNNSGVGIWLRINEEQNLILNNCVIKDNNGMMGCKEKVGIFVIQDSGKGSTIQVNGGEISCMNFIESYGATTIKYNGGILKELMLGANNTLVFMKEPESTIGLYFNRLPTNNRIARLEGITSIDLSKINMLAFKYPLSIQVIDGVSYIVVQAPSSFNIEIPEQNDSVEMPLDEFFDNKRFYLFPVVEHKCA